jgi:hypothetical protein
VDMQGCIPGTPRDLDWKPNQLWDTTNFRGWDLVPDGRFLMAKGDESNSMPVTKLIYVQNWVEELKRLVPTGKW